MNAIKNKKDIPKKYKWNLEQLLKSKNIKTYYREITKNVDSIFKLKGIITKSESNFLSYLKKSRKLSILVGMLYCYFYNKSSEDVSNEKNTAQLFEYKKFISNNYLKLYWTTNEILKSEKQIKIYLKNNKKYIKYFDRIFRAKKHKISDEHEKIISELDIIFSGPSDSFSLLTNADFDFGYINDSKKASVLLTQGNYREHFTSSDNKLRENAYKKFWKVYFSHKNVLSNLYHNNVVISNKLSKIYKYKNALDNSLFFDNVDKKFYLNLLSYCKKYTYLTNNYYKIRKKILKAQNNNPWTLSAPLFLESNKKFTIEKGQEIIFKALKILGPKYKQNIEIVFNNNSIDYFPYKGKRSGAYSYSSWDNVPLICMNWCGKYSDLSTLIHELGHSVHSIFSNDNQMYEYSHYPIFLAEIASIVNEMLLIKYLIKENIINKKAIINEFIKEFIATTFRQLQFAEYEMWSHDFVSNGNILNFENISKKCIDLNKIYFPRDKNDIYIDKYSGLWGLYVPHFYNDFYVYKYAIGMICAATIVSNIYSDKKYYKKYLYLLSSGGSKWPLKILKEIGIDLNDKSVYEKAFKMLQNFINELEKNI